MKKLMLMIAAAVCGMALFAASFTNGEKVYVAEKTAKVKASTGVFAKTLATVEYGDVLTVVQSGAKKSQVRVNDATTGWVTNSALTTKKIVKSGGSSVLASTEELALAGKGNIKATEDTLNEVQEQSAQATEQIKDAAAEAAEKIKDAVQPIIDPK